MTCQTTRGSQLSSRTGETASWRVSRRRKDADTLALSRRRSRNLYCLEKTEEKSRLDKLEATTPSTMVFLTWEPMRGLAYGGRVMGHAAFGVGNIYRRLNP